MDTIHYFNGNTRLLWNLTERLNLYNQGKDAKSKISRAEALDVFGDAKTYNEFLVNSLSMEYSVHKDTEVIEV